MKKLDTEAERMMRLSYEVTQKWLHGGRKEKREALRTAKRETPKKRQLA